MAKGGKVKKYDDGGLIDSLTLDQKAEYDGAATGQDKADILAKYAGNVGAKTLTPRMDSVDKLAGSGSSSLSTSQQSALYATAGNLAGNAVNDYVPAGNKNQNVIGKDIASGALKGAGTGAGIGAEAGVLLAAPTGGLINPATGAAIGAGLGALVGGGAGWAKGVKEKKADDAAQQAADQSIGQSRVGSAYKKGGILRKISDTKMKSGGLTSDKAKEILKDGTVHGKPITERQKHYFGYIAGGGKPEQYAGGGGVGGGGGMGAGGGSGVSSGGGGGIPTLGPVEHAKKPKGLLYALGGGVPYQKGTLNAQGEGMLHTVPTDTVYASPEGRYFHKPAGSTGAFSEITKEKYESYPQGQRGDYAKFANPDLTSAYQQIKATPSNVQVKTPLPETPGLEGKEIAAPSEALAPRMDTEIKPKPLTARIDEEKAEGGKIKGKGGPKADKIPMKAEEGSFVVPAENSKKAEELRSKFLAKGGTMRAGDKVGEGDEVPVKVSNGEHIFTPEEVAILKSKGVDLNRLAPHAEEKLGKEKGGKVLPDNQTLNPTGMSEKPNQGSIKDVGLNQGGLLGKLKKGGIHINPENKGKFTATKKATGKTTEELTHSSNPLTKKRAIFAQVSKTWNHKAEGGNIIDDRQKKVISSPQEADVEQKVNSKIVIPTSSQPVTKKKFVNTQTGIGSAIRNFDVSGQDTLKKGGIIGALKKAKGGSVNDSKIIQTGIKGPDDTTLIKISGSNTNHLYKAKGGKVNGYQDGTPGTGVQGPNYNIPQQNESLIPDPSMVWSNPSDNAQLLKAREDYDTTTSPTDTSTNLGKVRMDTSERPARLRNADVVAPGDPNQTAASTGATKGSWVPKALAAGQIGLGLAHTLAYERPVYTIPPEIQSAYAKANQEATFGLDPASKAAIESEIANRSATSRGLIAGAAGGNAGAAYNMIRNLNASSGQNLIKMYAADAAAKRAKQGQAYGLAASLANYKRFGYEQDMNRFLQNQNAGANLLQSGISNLAGSYDYDKALAAKNARATA